MVGNNAIDKLLAIYTKDYKGPLVSSGMTNNLFNPNRPIFWRFYVPLMLRDPHIWYGMELIKGPIISKAKFQCVCDNAEVAEYVDRQIKNFWTRGINYALDCLAWGYSAGEVLYDFNEEEGVIEYKDLKFLHQRDIKAVTKDGEIVACQVKHAKKNADYEELYLLPLKFVWFIHDKKHNLCYGRSRLEGAFDSWWECWMPKGFRSLRHMWFYRSAYDGGVLYFPDGDTEDSEGNVIPNVVLAQELLDRKESGSSLALPQKTGDNREWEWEPPKGNVFPDGLLEYGDHLRDEMWEGIGVPPEVAKQEDTGSFAGRRVPQQAFYSYLQQIANDICFAFDEQIIRNLVKLWAGKVPYTIEPISILQTLQEEEMGQVTGSMPGEEGEEPQLDEEGNPIEEDPNGMDMGDGRVEDRDSNAFNKQEQAFSKNKGKK